MDFLQAVKPAPSREHSKVDLVSFDASPKAALVDVVGLVGFLTIEAVGGVTSTVHLAVAALRARLAASMLLTPKVCGASARPGYAAGLVQGEKVARSSEHSKVAPGSEEVNVNRVEFVNGGGLGVIFVVGTFPFVHANVAGLASVLWARSVAATSNTCDRLANSV